MVGPTVTPATTWALVRTCCGAMTKPEPSIRIEHDSATPSILTMLGSARRRAGDLRTTALGAARLRLDSAPIALKTWEYRPFESRLRSWGKTGRYRAPRGITPSTVLSTREL